VGRLLGELGARDKQRLVVVIFERRSKFKKVQPGQSRRSPGPGGLGRSSKDFFFFVKAVSVQWRHALIALSLMASDDSNESLVGFGKCSLLRSHRRASGELGFAFPCPSLRLESLAGCLPRACEECLDV